MLTGRQIYEACRLTGRTTAGVSRTSGVAFATLVAAKHSDEPLQVDFMGINKLRRVLIDAGAEFYASEDGRPAVRMRRSLMQKSARSAPPL